MDLCHERFDPEMISHDFDVKLEIVVFNCTEVICCNLSIEYLYFEYRSKVVSNIQRLYLIVLRNRGEET